MSIAIDDEPTLDQYTATASQAVFIVSFPFISDGDLSVYARTAASDPDDADDLLASSVYTVAGAGTATGGTVTLDTPRSSGDIVTIVGSQAIDRTSIFPDINPTSITLNAQLNDLTIMVKQNQTNWDTRTPRYNFSAVVGADQVLLPVLDTGYIWRGTATGIEAFSLINQVVSTPAVTATSSIAIWSDATGTSIEDTTITVSGYNFAPLSAGNVIGINDTSAFQIPSGNTGERPGAPANGMIRYNSTTANNEIYEDASWNAILNATTGAPVGATYIVQTASALLTNEQVLASLATGIVKNTTTTGVLSIAAEGTDYYGPGGTDVAVADGGTGSSTAAGARTNLGLVIGTDVQAQDVLLENISDLSDPGADRIMFWDDSASTVTWLTAGTGLTITDTTIAASAGSGSMVLLNTQVASASATINFDNLLTSTYDVYKLFGSAVQSTDSGTLLFTRVGTGATPTYQSGATDYAWTDLYTDASASTIEFDATDSEMQIVGNRGPLANIGSALNFETTIYAPSDTSVYTYTSTVFAMRDTSTNVMTGTTIGIYLSVTAVTSIQCLFSSNTIYYGNFSLYGLAK